MIENKLYHPLIHAEFQYETGTPDYSGTSECNEIEYIILIFPKCQNRFLPLVFSSTILILKGMLIIILKKSCLEKSAYVVANNE